MCVSSFYATFFSCFLFFSSLSGPPPTFPCQLHKSMFHNKKRLFSGFSVFRFPSPFLFIFLEKLFKLFFFYLFIVVPVCLVLFPCFFLSLFFLFFFLNLPSIFLHFPISFHSRFGAQPPRGEFGNQRSAQP